MVGSIIMIRCLYAVDELQIHNQGCLNISLFAQIITLKGD